MSTHESVPPDGEPIAVGGAPEQATIEHTALPPDLGAGALPPVEPVASPFAEPYPADGPATGPLGGLIPEDRPELLVAAAFAGGALTAIALRTLVRR